MAGETHGFNEDTDGDPLPGQTFNRPLIGPVLGQPLIRSAAERHT